MRNRELIAEIYITENCNMRCRYCFVNKRKRTMSLATACQTIDFISSLKYDSVILCFFGGEPLLEFKLLKNIIGYAQKRNITRFNLCTNGTLLNSETLNYLAANNIIPMLSLDGTQAAQNLERIFQNGKPTFALLDKRLNLLKSYYKDKPLHVQISVTSHTAPLLFNSITYLLSKGLNLEINIVPIVLPERRYAWKQKDLEFFYLALSKIAWLWIKNRAAGRTKFKLRYMCCAPGRDLSELWKRDKSKNFCDLGERHLSISVDGMIYPCFVFCAIRKKFPFLLGDVWKGFAPSAAVSFKKIKYLKNSASVISCPAWNFLNQGDIARPAEVYYTFDQYFTDISRNVFFISIK